MNVFLGITGASGAPYAARLLQALSAAGVTEEPDEDTDDTLVRSAL